MESKKRKTTNSRTISSQSKKLSSLKEEAKLPSRFDAWASLLEDIRIAKNKLDFRHKPPSFTEEAWFRGHKNSSYELRPGLQRHCTNVGISTKYDVQSLEADLFFEFQARASHLLPTVEDGWEMLFLMRHYGMATRLLDWTSVLGVAIFFAPRHAADDDDPHIWVMNPYRLNEENTNDRDIWSPVFMEAYDEMIIDYNNPGMGWNKPRPIYPLARHNSRLHAQRGYFTVHGDHIGTMDQLNPKCMIRVDIPKTAWDPAREFLSLAGINDFSLFPDLTGLTNDVHRSKGIN